MQLSCRIFVDRGFASTPIQVTPVSPIHGRFNVTPSQNRRHLNLVSAPQRHPHQNVENWTRIGPIRRHYANKSDGRVRRQSPPMMRSAGPSTITLPMFLTRHGCIDWMPSSSSQRDTLGTGDTVYIRIMKEGLAPFLRVRSSWSAAQHQLLRLTLDPQLILNVENPRRQYWTMNASKSGARASEMEGPRMTLRRCVVPLDRRAAPSDYLQKLGPPATRPTVLIPVKRTADALREASPTKRRRPLRTHSEMGRRKKMIAGAGSDADISE
ncbi:hypothetical protein B0H11DRAFT_1966727 [Mycena galericulata]|nr:hypothetical protein B0H11DRAFT_1966727 [Mycena galericulata]